MVWLFQGLKGNHAVLGSLCKTLLITALKNVNAAIQYIILEENVRFTEKKF